MFLVGYSLTLVSVLVLLMQWSIGKGMVEYVVAKEIETLKPVVTSLINEYKINNSWQNIYNEHGKFRRLISEQLKNSDFSAPELRRGPDNRKHRNQHRSQEEGKPTNSNNKRGDQHSPSIFDDKPNKRPPPTNGRGAFDKNKRPPPPKGAAHYALINLSGEKIVGHLNEELEYTRTPIEVDGNIVGYFAVSKRNQLTEEYELNFVEQQQHYLWYIALVVMILVAIGTFPLARHIVGPIKLIARGMHKLTQGDYEKTIDMNRQDELGALSEDYNELSKTLADAESYRKRWLANTSHELRTPVAILRGELEAMIDGVREKSLENIVSANDEVKHLQKLIDDLNQLTSAQVGGMSFQKEINSLAHFMTEELEKYRGYLSDAGINLRLHTKKQDSDFEFDHTRINQLFENIINNCIKYASATELYISLQIIILDSNDRLIEMTFEDDGVGVDAVHRELLFEHLYRVEDSRNRGTGGSGLGLSICRHIVEGHGGNISADKSSLGGLSVKVTFTVPAKED